jgi:hypothetical protein
MAVGGRPAHASATSMTTNIKTPVDVAVVVPCANGGAGEVVYFSGATHHLIHLTFDGAGGFHIVSYDSHQSLYGTGETTGATYRGTVAAQTHTNHGTDALPFTFTYVAAYQIIGQGPYDNLVLHVSNHFTINPDRTITAVAYHFRATCG